MGGYSRLLAARSEEGAGAGRLSQRVCCDATGRLALSRPGAIDGEKAMSWMPDKDPVLGDKASCDALELAIVPRVRDLGGFEVRRALPHGKRQMVGPFIFFRS